MTTNQSARLRNCGICNEESRKTVIARERVPGSLGWTRISFPLKYRLCESCLRLAGLANAIQESYTKGKYRNSRSSHNPNLPAVKIKFDEVIVFAKTFNWLRMMHMQKIQKGMTS